MKTAEVRDLTTEELHEKVAELREELFNLKFRKATSPLDNPLQLRSLRRDIARCLTVIRERGLGIRGEGEEEG